MKVFTFSSAGLSGCFSDLKTPVSPEGLRNRPPEAARDVAENCVDLQPLSIRALGCAQSEQMSSELFSSVWIASGNKRCDEQRFFGPPAH